MHHTEQSLCYDPNFCYNHYAPVFGLVCGSLGVSLELCDRMYLKIFLRDLISAAIRLNIIGPIAGVSIQAQAFIKLETLLERHYMQHSVANIDSKPANKVDDNLFDLTFNSKEVEFYNNIKPMQTAPIIDILQSRHDLLYSRLFSS